METGNRNDFPKSNFGWFGGRNLQPQRLRVITVLPLTRTHKLISNQAAIRPTLFCNELHGHKHNDVIAYLSANEIV